MNHTTTRPPSFLLASIAALTALAAVGCGAGHAPAQSAQGPNVHSGGDYAASEARADYKNGGYQQPGEATASDDADFNVAPAPHAPTPMAKSAPQSTPSRDRSASRRRPQPMDPFKLKPRPENRPGLATQWGEKRTSRVSSAPFVRADRSSPFALSKLFYNDASGVAGMSDGHGSLQVSHFRVGSGHLEIALRSGNGRFLNGFTSHSDNFVVGNQGQRYSIVLKNHSPGRIEAVVSVDGLDVIDGKSASLSKRGYLIDPFGQLEIDGFRTSTSEVAAFRFGAVGSSYSAKKTGDTRNVGVIGMAMFHERGDSPRHWNNRRDNHKRRNADPFPQRFAEPASW